MTAIPITDHIIEMDFRDAAAFLVVAHVLSLIVLQYLMLISFLELVAVLITVS